MNSFAQNPGRQSPVDPTTRQDVEVLGADDNQAVRDALADLTGLRARDQSSRSTETPWSLPLGLASAGVAGAGSDQIQPFDDLIEFGGELVGRASLNAQSRLLDERGGDCCGDDRQEADAGDHHDRGDEPTEGIGRH
jgi:hypothetical protein